MSYIEREAVLDTIGVQNNRIWNEVYDLPVADVAPGAAWAVAASNRARQKGVGLLRVQDTGEPALEVVPDVWVPDGW